MEVRLVGGEMDARKRARIVPRRVWV